MVWYVVMYDSLRHRLPTKVECAMNAASVEVVQSPQMSTVFHPPPPFFPLLAVWLLFPLHAPLTLLVLDAPFGRFAWKSRLNLPGNLAWAVMEIVAVSDTCIAADNQPITFLLNLDAGALSPRARTLAGLYVAHYAHRAVFSPLVLAPKRAPLHVMVVLSAIIFNVL